MEKENENAIVSINKDAPMADFVNLMSKTDEILNDDAKVNREYYAGRSGTPLEKDVYEALNKAAMNTPFECTLELISKNKFPDIVADGCYGVEVKSTKSDQWTSTGSSILEHTRVDNVERIYMTFGKLGGNPIEFLSKPYEECLSGIGVTHSPRYMINMKLNEGESIFDKMRTSYDDLRQSEDPIKSVSDYYRSTLKPGERLWWVGNPDDEAAPMIKKLMNELPRKEKIPIILESCLKHPEIFGGEYNNLANCLADNGIVDTHLRDEFSSGGKLWKLKNGEIANLPAIYRRIHMYSEKFLELIKDYPRSVRELVKDNKCFELDTSKDLKDRVTQWAEKVSEYAKKVGSTDSDPKDVLMMLLGMK